MGFLKPVGKFLGEALPIVGPAVGTAFDIIGKNKAVNAQTDANREALDWQKQQAAAAQELYKQQYQDWLWGRNQLLSRYGLAQAPMQSFSPQAQAPQAQAAPLGTMMQGGQAPPGPYQPFASQFSMGQPTQQGASLAALLGRSKFQ